MALGVMATVMWAAVGVAGVAAPANWWSRWVDDARVERWTKPTVLGALIVMALTIDPDDLVVGDPVRWWFVGALVLSLAGDVFLLDGDRWFLAGLGSFLAGHVAYTVGFFVADPWRWWTAGVAVVLVAAVGVAIGPKVVAGATRRDAGLRLPVVAYLVIISTMVVAAAAAGNGWAIAGAVLFLASDSILGWRMFVEARRWMAPAVMISYHLAQAGLVASLIIG